MNRLNITNYNIYAIGGGQLTYSKYIITKDITIDKMSRNR